MVCCASGALRRFIMTSPSSELLWNRVRNALLQCNSLRSTALSPAAVLADLTSSHMCSALIAKATEPGYTLQRLSADFRTMCGMAMLLLWRRSQSAAQYVCNMLDAGNARLAALPQGSQAVTAPQVPQPAAPTHAEKADAFWLSGHEVKDLLTVHVAVGNDTGLLLTGRQAAVSNAAAGSAAQKRKFGAPGAAAPAGKRRRPADDGVFELSAKQQQYVSELLVFITVGVHGELDGAERTDPTPVPDAPLTAAAPEEAADRTPKDARQGAKLPPLPHVPPSSGQPADLSAIRHKSANSDGRGMPQHTQRDKWTQAR